VFSTSKDNVPSIVGVGRGAIEATLLLNGQQLAGSKQPEKAHGDITWQGRQHGVVSLSERKLRVEKPGPRKKGKGTSKEVAIPAYEALVISESASLVKRVFLFFFIVSHNLYWLIRQSHLCVISVT